ncbi:MAG: cation diffusion facilitator family transporter [Bacteroidota bacterium]|nr:cation diffusion facilitator family transporter [Bacteroidota bacterium]MDP4215757.1 cation diffusion facilitator family transporter [Bacteroidota bacterium]MDP4246784.1 cation diffusion facilitator family transporter [Bacteroidota bacterium]MDP4253181.1 cation diffusion facilitator family transporter [Bacteroidota bacterium]MDP4259368.1 cation diffusion facilitator family transporter [Bacteroidota bacterium]
MVDKSTENIRLQQWVVAIAILLFALKMTAYFITGSVAILTDALESTVNVIAGFIGLYSLTVAAKPRDVDHPYGHGKAEFLSAAVEGSMVVVAGLFIIYESISNLLFPHPLQKLDKGMYLVGATALVNFALGAVCLYIGRRNQSAALIASGKHLQTDTYSTAGIILGLAVILWTKLAWIDSAISLVFALIILYSGYHILRSSIAGIMDEADVKLLNRMIAFLNARRRENWIDLHNLRVIKYGRLLHVDCHLTVPWYLNVVEAHAEIDALTSMIRAEFGEAMEFFVHSDACMDFSCPVCIKSGCNVRRHPFRHRIEWTMDNVVPNRKHNFTFQTHLPIT